MEETYVQLANGKKAPLRCVYALTEFENEWPGATFHNARPAIVTRVLDAAHLMILEHCDDTPEVRKVLDILGWEEDDGDEEDLIEDEVLHQD